MTSDHLKTADHDATRPNDRQMTVERSGRLLNDKGLSFFIILSVCFAAAQVFYYLGYAGAFTVVTILLVTWTLVYGLLFLRPEEMFVLLFLIITTRYITGIGNYKELGQLVPAVFLVLVLLIKGHRLPKKRFPLLFALYAALLTVIVIRGFEFMDESKATTFIRRWEFITAITCFFAGYYLSEKLDMKRFVRILFGFYAIVLAVSMFMYVAQISEMPLFNTFSWMQIPNDNRFGILSGAGAVCIVIMMCYKNVLSNRVMRYTLYVISGFAVLAGGGRATLVGIIIGVLGYLFFVKRRRSVVIWLAVLFLVVAQVDSVESLSRYVPEKLSRVFEIANIEMIAAATHEVGQGADLSGVQVLAGSEADLSTFARLYMWNRAVSGIREKPLLGQGLKNPYEGMRKSTLTVEEDVTQEALLMTGNLHNTYISLAYIAGLPAMILFVLFLVGVIRKSYCMVRLYESGPYIYLFVAILMMFVMSFVGDLYYSAEFMIFAGLICSHYESSHRRPCHEQ